MKQLIKKILRESDWDWVDMSDPLPVKGAYVIDVSNLNYREKSFLPVEEALEILKNYVKN